MSKPQEFFLVALPGLEDLVATELQRWFPDLQGEITHGGVTVQAPLDRGLAMNLALKTPTRILIRLSTFKVKDFPKLYNKVKSLPWDEWVDTSCVMEVHPSTRLSRLKIKSRISDACLDAWTDFQKEKGIKPNYGKKLALYARFVEDECTLSLDTSGELLHKRGWRKLVGEAPLRETIAAALIELVAKTDPREEPIELVDPMAGSGTFLLEAGLRDSLAESRAFAFGNFAKSAAKAPKLSRPPFSRLIGFERDAKTLQAAKGNLKSVEAVRLINEDIFQAEPLPEASGRRWLFCNPPYGERLKVKEPLGELYAKLFQACERVAKPDRACFLLPSKAVKGRFPLPVGWKVLEKRPFLNGGIPVTAFVFGRMG